MIEIEVTVECENCSEELKYYDGDLSEIVNFGESVVACWSLDSLPEGWYREGDTETYCPKCANELNLE